MWDCLPEDSQYDTDICTDAIKAFPPIIKSIPPTHPHYFELFQLALDNDLSSMKSCQLPIDSEAYKTLFLHMIKMNFYPLDNLPAPLNSDLDISDQNCEVRTLFQ